MQPWFGMMGSKNRSAEMALITIDLTSEEDVEFGRVQLNRAASRFRVRSVAKRELEQLETASEEEKNEAIKRNYAQALRDLLKTKTGLTLLIPFVDKFKSNSPVSIEEIAQVVRCEIGVDPKRKIHSLIAGLGRWETPRGLKIFEQLPGKPARYKMTAPVWEIFNDEINAIVDSQVNGK
jgi:hypothetical protein